MTFREITAKQVVQTIDGVILGQADDMVLDETGTRVQAFILYGAPKLFGLLGRGEDLVIPVEKVKMFGVDVLLVDTRQEKAARSGASGGQGPGLQHRFAFFRKFAEKN